MKRISIWGGPYAVCLIGLVQYTRDSAQACAERPWKCPSSVHLRKPSLRIMHDAAPYSYSRLVPSWPASRGHRIAYTASILALLPHLLLDALPSRELPFAFPGVLLILTAIFALFCTTVDVLRRSARRGRRRPGWGCSGSKLRIDARLKFSIARECQFITRTTYHSLAPIQRAAFELVAVIGLAWHSSLPKRIASTLLWRRWWRTGRRNRRWRRTGR